MLYLHPWVTDPLCNAPLENLNKPTANSAQILPAPYEMVAKWNPFKIQLQPPENFWNPLPENVNNHYSSNFQIIIF